MGYLLSFMEGVRWQDLVDIIINSYIIFRLYIIFRGTNAFRVLIGIALLWFFQRLALSLGLIVTSWAIQAITAVAALIIIVVFRNEIRSVLQAKNLKTILWGFPQKTVLTPLEVVVESAFYLARKNIGALLVFPAKEDLKEVVQSGILWDGVVSREMIVSIFWRDNPVHDGAAIIKGDRIVEVGALLPLSHRKDIPSSFGTRHRAALGLSENSDALVVIVSEEKGTVLAAKKGGIKTLRRKEDLLQLLMQHTGIARKPLEFYKKEKFEISVMALLSVLFVISIWASFFKGMETLITIQTPIDYMNRDPKVEILDTSINSVSLNLSGSGPLIKSIRPEQVLVRIDLRDATVGKNRFAITKQNITLPPGIKLKNVYPKSVDVTLDFPTRKEFPIQVDWAGKLADSLRIVGVTVAPDTIELVGRNRILSQVSTVYTEKIHLDKIDQSGSVTVGLTIRPSSLKIVAGAKDQVTIKFEVAKREPL